LHRKRDQKYIGLRDQKNFPAYEQSKNQVPRGTKAFIEDTVTKHKKATIESGQMPGKRQKAQRRNRKKAYLLRSPCFVVEMLIY